MYSQGKVPTNLPAQTGTNLESRNKILVACKYNLARSQAIKLFLRSHYDQFEFEAFGTNAGNSIQIPKQVSTILYKWGLVEDINQEIRSQAAPQIKPETKLLVADKSIVQNLISIGCVPETLINIQNFPLGSTIVPCEPTSHNDTKFEYELALNLYSANLAFKEIFGSHVNFSSKAYLPTSEASIESSIHMAAATSKLLNIKLIYFDFEGLTNVNWSQFEFTPIKFENFDQIENFSPSIKEAERQIIFIPAWELMDAPRTLLSVEFRNSLEKYFPVGKSFIALLPPLEIGGTKRPNSILASIHFKNVELVG